MRILLVQTLSYVYSRGGAHKANRILMEGLAARGHTCRVVAPASSAPGPQAREQFLDILAARGVRTTATSARCIEFPYQDVEVHAVVEDSQMSAWHAHGLHAYLAEQIRAFDPTWVLVVDDYSYTLLKTTLEVCPTRAVYVVHTPAALPFGPAAFYPNPAKTPLLERAAGIITVSDYMRAYIRQWGGLESAVIRFPVYGSPPFPVLADFDAGYVTLINPSAIKGLPIFLELARRMPDVPFAAVPTWATTGADRAALAQLPNVRILPPTDTIDELYAQTRVVLAPSLWQESFGQIAVEAMLRGVPVLASDTGGLPEAKLGVDYVLPVRPIARYEQRLDEQWIPVPVVPEQDVTPWEAALRELLADRAHYERIAAKSRAAALAYVERIGIAPFESFLEQLQPARDPGTPKAAAPAPADPLRERLSRQSAQQRALLAMRLNRKAAVQS